MKLSRNHMHKNILIFTFTYIHSFCLAYPANDELTLQDAGETIVNKIEIYISNAAYQNIKNTDGNKKSLRKPTIIINGDSISSKDMHTRGNTTLYYRRKSFSLNLESKATFHHGDRTESMKKFYAISLSMDKNYIRNRLAFGMMEEIQLFGLFYSYCELLINDESEGIYMIVERPQDWAMNKKNSPLVIRRGYNQKIDKIKTGKKIDKAEAKNYKNYYNQIYKSLNKYEGQALYDTLSQWIDLELYMKWLAFNFFVRNGDYTDEVYFCIDPVVDKFKFIPWDYDDIFAIAPHEGMAIKKDVIGDKFIFSSEDKLDQKIANDSFLYSKYLLVFQTTLNILSEEALKSIFDSTYAELLPYVQKDEIVQMAAYDLYKDVSVHSIKIELEYLFNNLTQTRVAYMNYLDHLKQ